MNTDLSLLSLIVRMSIALALALVLLTALSKVAARRNIGGSIGRRSGGAGIEVLSRHALTKSSAIALVRVGDRTLLVGVTDSSIDLLLEDAIDLTEHDAHVNLDLTSLPSEEASTNHAEPRTALAPGTASWATTGTNLINALRERTVRRA